MEILLHNCSFVPVLQQQHAQSFSILFSGIQKAFLIKWHITLLIITMYCEHVFKEIYYLLRIQLPSLLDFKRGKPFNFSPCAKEELPGVLFIIF